MEWIRYGGDFTVNMIAGFYRSPDVMGWHAATVAMISLILAMTARGARRWSWFLVCAFALVALMLCGRRKMAYMIPAFLVTFVWLSLMAGQKRPISGFLALVLVPIGSVLLVGDWLGRDSAFVRYYTEHSVEAVDQLQSHGFESLLVTVDQAGVFGSGLGVATPGSHHLDVARPKIWQESAPSRIMVELGVPGFLALLALVAAILKGAWNVVQVHQQSNSPYSGYLLGLTSLFLANVGSLIVSGQILADPFIAFFLGFSIGVVLCFGRKSIVESFPRDAVGRRSGMAQQRNSATVRQGRQRIRPGPA
jgi:O-antigen ligase